MRAVGIILAETEFLSVFFLKLKIHKAEIANLSLCCLYIVTLWKKFKELQSTILLRIECCEFKRNKIQNRFHMRRTWNWLVWNTLIHVFHTRHFTCSQSLVPSTCGTLVISLHLELYEKFSKYIRCKNDVYSIADSKKFNLPKIVSCRSILLLVFLKMHLNIIDTTKVIYL